MAEPPLRVGDMLKGFCDGAFGRDSYGTKTVEAIGADWVVVRGGSYGRSHAPDFYHGTPEDLVEFRVARDDDSEDDDG